MSTFFWTGKLSLKMRILIDTILRAINKKYVLGYRLEFWLRTEKQIFLMMKEAGFKDIRTKRFIWRNLFKTLRDGCNFSSAVTSNRWFAKVPENKRAELSEKTFKYFE